MELGVSGFCALLGISTSVGPIKTPIFGKTGLPKEEIEEFEKEVTARVPMKRVGKPEEVAATVALGFAGRIVQHRNRNKCGWRLRTDLNRFRRRCGNAVNADRHHSPVESEC
jgi:NAD(P)-dependent dehydrogenase (short-subunit alcohol dehydrogenase family)